MGPMLLMHIVGQTPQNNPLQIIFKLTQLFHSGFDNEKLHNKCIYVFNIIYDVFNIDGIIYFYFRH